MPDTGPACPSTTTCETFTERTRDGVSVPEPSDVTLMGHTGKDGGQDHLLLISSAEGSPARTSPSPVSEPASLDLAADCSSSSPGSPMSLFDREDGSLSRTSPACSLPTVDEISGSWYGRWGTSGFTTSLGECWTAATSESPNAGGVCSSLPDVLVASSHSRFSLSARAAEGILRRAAKRGRGLPDALERALRSLAQSDHTSDRGRTTAEG